MTVTDPTAVLFDEDSDPALTQLVAEIRREADGLEILLADARLRQWSVSPVPKPREDTRERSMGAAPSDPVGDTVTDARRLALRAQVVASERVLRETLTRLHVVRLGLARKIEWWDGE